VKKDLLFKNIEQFLVPHYTVTLLDEEQIQKIRQKTSKGAVPPVQLVAFRMKNKKVTSIEGLDLF